MPGIVTNLATTLSLYTNQSYRDVEAYDDIDNACEEYNESCVLYKNNSLMHDSDIKDLSKMAFQDDSVLDDQSENAFHNVNDEKHSLKNQLNVTAASV